MASLITEKEIQSKCDPIIQDFFMKSLQIILQSRISSRRQTSLGKSSSSSSSSKGGMGGRQFNLALKDCPVPVDGPEVCNVDGFRSIVLDVLLVQLKHQQTGTDESSVLKHGKLDMMRRSVTSQQEDCKTVLERWVLQYLNCDEEQSVGKQTSGAGDVAVLYKSTMIMLRSLYCMTRLLPAYGLFQLSNSSASVNLFGITYRISPLPRPLSRGKNVQMKSHKFTPIKAPSGKICLSVDYCSVRASDFETPSQIRLPSIMIDYIRSPTTDAVKKLSYRGGTSLKINSGHCLPQTFIRQRSLTGSVSKLKAGATLSGAYSYDWSEAELGDCSFPFAINDSKAGKLCNRKRTLIILSMGCLAFMNGTSSFAPQTCEATVNEETAFQSSSDAAVGALVELLRFAPPLQQSATSVKSYGFSKSLESPSHPPCTTSYSPQEEVPSSSSRKTAAQALKELGSYQDIKKRILDEARKKAAQN